MCILPPENRDVSRNLSDTFHTFHYFPRVVYFDVFLIFCFFVHKVQNAHVTTCEGNGESSTRVAVGEPSQVLETAVREIRWLTWFVWFAGALCATVQLHSMAKLIGAFVCPDAMWNFPDRCADVQKY